MTGALVQIAGGDDSLPGALTVSDCVDALTAAAPDLVVETVETPGDAGGETSGDRPPLACLVVAATALDGVTPGAGVQDSTVPVVVLAESATEPVPAGVFTGGGRVCKLADTDEPTAALVDAVLASLDGPVDATGSAGGSQAAAGSGAGEENGDERVAEDGDERVAEDDTRELTNARERYRRITEQNIFGIYIIQDGLIRYANPKAAEIFGYEPEEMIDEMTAFDVVAKEDHPRLRDNIKKREEGDLSELQYELTGVRRDGTEFELEVHSGVIEYDGEPALLGALLDITERKQRMEELERYEALVQAVPDTVYSTDIDGNVTFHNAAALDQFGYDESAFGDLHISDVMDESDVERLREATRRLLSTEYDTDGKAVVEYTAISGDGRRFPAEAHFSLLTGTEDSEFAGTAGITRDITERKQREERLQVLNRLLRHNLRNDLSVILGTMESLVDRFRVDADEEGAMLAETAWERARGLVRMSKEIRRIQIALERERLERPSLDAVEMIHNRVADFREEYPTATIETDLPAAAAVDADYALEVALDHLIENAIEHNDSDAPWVEVAVEAVDADRGDWYEVRVADDGPGIPDHERAVVHDDTEVTPLKHGSGLGLWAVVWIVQTFGGSVDIGVDETGSTVRLRLRAAG